MPLDSLLAMSPDGFVCFSGDGTLRFANPGFCCLFDCTPEEMRQVGRRDFVAWLACRLGVLPDDFIDSVPQRLVLPGVPRRTLNAEMRSTVDGSQVFHFRDPAVAAASPAEEFLGAAAQALRTPMVSTFGLVEFLLAGQFSEEARHDLLLLIHRQIKRMIGTATELLELARIEDAKGRNLLIETQPLGPIVRRSIETWPPSPVQRLEVDLRHETALVAIDAARIQGAVEKLLAHARLHTPPGGVVRLCTLLAEGPAGSELGLAVSDEGTGLQSLQLARLFERRYHSTQPSGSPEASLGMAIVKETIEAHGGRINVHSEYGHGTTVTMWLPVQQALAAA